MTFRIKFGLASKLYAHQVFKFKFCVVRPIRFPILVEFAAYLLERSRIAEERAKKNQPINLHKISKYIT